MSCKTSMIRLAIRRSTSPFTPSSLSPSELSSFLPSAGVPVVNATFPRRFSFKKSCNCFNSNFSTKTYPPIDAASDSNDPNLPSNSSSSCVSTEEIPRKITTTQSRMSEPSSTNNSIERESYENDDNTSTQKSNNNKKKFGKKQPKPLIKTARGQAAARKQVIPNANDGIIPNRHSSETCPTHLMRGMTPCDPAPPPFLLDDYGDDSLYTLVLLRHGESEWNSQNRYTGWCDVNLTKRGEYEARAAGRLLQENGIEVDHVFTSVLKRASITTNMSLSVAGMHWVPITKSWRLNERHYGALQGYNKDTAYDELGIDQELVMKMRRSYDTRPPNMNNDHPYWHGGDRRYKKLSHQQLENTRAESLKDAAGRVLPLFNSLVLPSLRAGNKCMIVSHANTLRTLIKHIDNISDEDIKGMSIPTGVPMLYRLDKHFRPVDPNVELEFRYMAKPKGYTWGTSRSHGFHGVYLGDLERLQDIQSKRDKTNRDWQRIMLRNFAKQLDAEDSTEGKSGCGILETRHLYYKILNNMQKREYRNMLLLGRMKDILENMIKQGGGKHRYLTLSAFEGMINKLHLDAEGYVVEPFVAANDQIERKKREKEYKHLVALDLEKECLIK